MKRQNALALGTGATLLTAVVCGFLAAACSGCFSARERYERSEYLEAASPETGRFAAETHNGAIAVTGGDDAICRVRARITGYAPDIDTARRLAEQVRITLVERGGGLATQIEKPHMPANCGIGVEFDVALPRRTNLQLDTHNGAIRVSDIVGDVRATTHNGEVRVERAAGRRVDLETHNGTVLVEGVTGEAALKTYNGEIICRQVVGPVTATTHNGNVEIVYSESAPPALESRIMTYNGSITFVAPPNLSGKVRIQTHNGSVKTAVPITVQGEIQKNRIIGTVRAGEGNVHLETHNGSISLR
ncbi:MAG: DUF4097 family beta strand repeat protein [Phycisphaerae bacterium]|nr:DUF4097 family beta strand repeat protein [Phycisphaerae bacterium]